MKYEVVNHIGKDAMIKHHGYHMLSKRTQYRLGASEKHQKLKVDNGLKILFCFFSINRLIYSNALKQLEDQS